MTKQNILIILLIVFLVLFMFYSNNLKRERDLYKNQVQNDFKSKYLQLERELRSSERQRMALVLCVDSIDNRNSDLVRVNKLLDSTLRKIRGFYSKKSPSQLETEMIDRYNKSK